MAWSINDEPILPNTRFGRLVVCSVIGKTHNRQKIWECICDCGNIKSIRADSLQSGRSQSCGCLRLERVTTHGMTKSPEFSIWGGILDRVRNPSKKDAHNYRDRGIDISDEWATSFESFYRDMGPRPSPKHSIERIDNDKGYCKENCKWATPSEQHTNKRTNVRITVGNKSLTAIEWSRELGGSSSLIYNRLRQGWSPELAATTPPQKRRFPDGVHSIY